MADAKISALPASTTPLAGTEVLPIVQSGVTKKTSVESVLTSVQPSGVVNGITFLNASKVATTNSNIFYNGTTFSTSDGVRGFGLTAGATCTLATTVTVGGAFVDLNFRSREFKFTVNNTDHLTLVQSGNANLLNGNIAINTAGKGVLFSGNVLWRTGAGTPEGAVTAPVGSMYTDTTGGAGTTLYVKESGAGNTGWVGK
jgi:hypothetical protein